MVGEILLLLGVFGLWCVAGTAITVRHPGRGLAFLLATVLVFMVAYA